MPLDSDERQEIEDLLSRYMLALDDGSGEERLREIFTEDVLIESGPGPYNGVEGLREFVRRRVPEGKETQRRHLVTNCLIEGDGDHASIQAYFVTFKTTKANPGSPSVFVGTYDLEAKKVSGTWRIKRSTVHMDSDLVKSS